MNILQHKKNNTRKAQLVSLIWSDNCSVQKLLDVVADIIAEDYIEIAKENPDLFSTKGGAK